jgi:phosphoglycerol transferase MdoB-like AlkP superfamily enzyme
MLNKLPKLIRFLITIVFLELILFTIFRIAFIVAFAKYGDNLNFTNILYSFWIGFRFDIQLAILISLPIFLLGGIKYIGIFKSIFAKYFWLLYILMVNIAIILLYIIDFAYFDFFKKMVDSSILRYFYDIGEAMKMLNEGYPLVSTSIIALLFFALIFVFLNYLFSKILINKDNFKNKKTKFVTYFIFTILFIFAGFGKLEQYPWRWSEAFYSSNSFLSYLSSNPVTYFVNTLKNTDVKYDEVATKKYYKDVSDFLEVTVKDDNNLSIVRVVKPKHSKELTFNKPNIIFILGESTSYARSSISANPLNATPFIKYMADNGISYNNYYTPHAGTARSVWTSTTGLSDVERMKTSSRNPMTVEQNMILNSLQDYEKFYFIGGSLSWGNVRGVIGNIDGIHTYEERQYKNSPHNDVWGISDIHLVSEANSVLKKQVKPFFAFIQLSGNHSPNTIPSENFGFKESDNISKKDLLNYGFDGSLDQFNGQKFLDYSVKRLITLAKEEKYFDNTIFIFVGDHGLSRKAIHVRQSEQQFATHTLHTPLVIYAPKLIKHKTIDYPVGEVDIMATIAGLSGNTYINSTMGRDILDENFKNKDHYMFFMTHEQNPTINLLGENYLFRIRANGENARLYNYYDENNYAQNIINEHKEIANKMKNLTLGIYEQTRYTRYHNSTNSVEKRLKNIE